MRKPTVLALFCIGVSPFVMSQTEAESHSWLRALAGPQSGAAEPKKDDDDWENCLNFRYLVLRPEGSPKRKVDYAPGYIDPTTHIFHVWKGVSFPGEKSLWTGPYRRVGALEANRKGMKVVEYDPLPIYVKLGDGKVAVGYYGQGQGDFYPWKDVVIEEKEIPDDALKADERVFSGSTFKESTTEVVAPKHILDKPELWKKVK
jgi:hypothetical protein